MTRTVPRRGASGPAAYRLDWRSNFCDVIPLWGHRPRRPRVPLRRLAAFAIGCLFQERGMNRLSGRVQWALALWCAGLGATCVARADAVSAVQVLRVGGCGGVVPAARPLLRSALLDQVAQEWAAGSSLPAATQRSAWRAQATTGVHVNGPDSSLLELLRRSDCRALARPGLRQIGVYRRGSDNWLVLAGGPGLPDTPR